MPSTGQALYYSSTHVEQLAPDSYWHVALSALFPSLHLNSTDNSVFDKVASYQRWSARVLDSDSSRVIRLIFLTHDSTRNVFNEKGLYKTKIPNQCVWLLQFSVCNSLRWPGLDLDLSLVTQTWSCNLTMTQLGLDLKFLRWLGHQLLSPSGIELFPSSWY